MLKTFWLLHVGAGRWRKWPRGEQRNFWAKDLFYFSLIFYGQIILLSLASLGGLLQWPLSWYWIFFFLIKELYLSNIKKRKPPIFGFFFLNWLGKIHAWVIFTIPHPPEASDSNLTRSSEDQENVSVRLSRAWRKKIEYPALVYTTSLNVKTGTFTVSVISAIKRSHREKPSLWYP